MASIEQENQYSDYIISQSSNFQKACKKLGKKHGKSMDKAWKKQEKAWKKRGKSMEKRGKAWISMIKHE